MWKLSIVDDQGQKTVVNLVRDEYTIGRSEGNTIRLTERNVSRHHARVVRTQFGYVLIDAGSTLGVHVNGVHVNGEQELAHKDVLQLADYRIDVVDEDLETQEQGHLPFSSSPPSSGRLPNRLVVLIGPNQGMEFALEGERFLIGRGEECDFCIEHASVSRVHAEVRKADPTRFEILDKGSANGLRVNGHDMPRALLDSRDVVELGDVVLKFIPEGQVFRASPAEGQRIAALGGLGPPPAPTGRATSGRSLILAAVIGGCLAAILALVRYTWRDTSEPETASTGAVRASALPAKPEAPPESRLDEAKQLAARGDLLAMHAALEKFPAHDPVRSTNSFRELESAWANAMIEAARRADDTATRRELLDLVARAESVPSALREAAFEELKKTTEGSIDLSELESPSAKHQK